MGSPRHLDHRLTKAALICSWIYLNNGETLVQKRLCWQSNWLCAGGLSLRQELSASTTADFCWRVLDRQWRSNCAGGDTFMVAAAEMATQIPPCPPAQNITVHASFEFSDVPACFQI